MKVMIVDSSGRVALATIVGSAIGLVCSIPAQCNKFAVVPKSKMRTVVAISLKQ